MRLDQLLCRVEDKVAGIDCFKLGDLVEAYIEDHKLSRKRSSGPLVEELRAELRKAGYRIFPKELPNSQAQQEVYVISQDGITALFHMVLRRPPSPHRCELLNDEVSYFVDEARQ